VAALLADSDDEAPILRIPPCPALVSYDSELEVLIPWHMLSRPSSTSCPIFHFQPAVQANALLGMDSINLLLEVKESLFL
jgi:hypothetical protein